MSNETNISPEEAALLEKKKKQNRLTLLSVVGGIVLICGIQIAKGNGDAVIGFFKAAAYLLTGLSILVVLHELGHYLAARAFGMRVEKFYLFMDLFDVKLFSFKKGDTEYGIGWAPIGGYVKIAGMVDENMDTSFMQSEPQPWEFRSKPAWQRLIVMIGGVVMNVIVGVLILSFVKFSYGDKRTPIAALSHGIEVVDTLKFTNKDGKKGAITSMGHYLGFKTGDKLVSFKGEALPYFEDYSKPNLLVKSDAFYEVERNGQKVKIEVPADALDKLQSDSIYPEIFTINVPASIVPDSTSPAFKAGLRENDLITSLDGQPIALYSDLTRYVRTKKPLDSIKVSYKRNNTDYSVAFVLDSNAKMGVAKNPELADKLKTQLNYGIGESIVLGTKAAFEVVTDNISGMGKMFAGKLNARKSTMGPVGMGQVYSKVVDNDGLKGFLMLTGLISMMLAFMNIFPLPLPVLDGGHVMFLLYEMIVGKPAPEKVFNVAQTIGLVLVLGLMLFTLGNDVLRLL